jgi:putative peptide zinc metalloprotease protein
MPTCAPARRARLLAAFLVALVLALAPPAGAQDAGTNGNAGDNAAIAVNTKDGASVFKLAFAVTRTMGEVVDNQNAAVAYSSCTACKTVAIAVQVVLVMGDPDTFTPENVAIAINQDCTACETFAAAVQIVIGVGSDLVRLTGEGRHRIAEIRKALRDLGKSDLPFDQLAAEVRRLSGELKDVFATQLEPVPKQHEGDQNDEDAGAAESPTPEASPTEEPSASPTPDSTATPEGQPTAEPTPQDDSTPTPTPTPTPTASPEPTP